jgi:hypothetical protein
MVDNWLTELNQKLEAGESSLVSEYPMSLAAALADRYRLERELGQGGMAGAPVAEATGPL